MRALLALSRGIDALNARLGWVADWLVLLSCLISAGNAFSRYAFGMSSNAWLEIQWYMFAALVMLGASYTLQRNEHVRVDIVYANVSTRRQIGIDVFGFVLFMLPATIIMTYLSWPIFHNSALTIVAGQTNPPRLGPSGPRITGMSPVKSMAPIA